MSSPTKMVAAFPYEGGLLWLFDKNMEKVASSHSYYRVLIGITPQEAGRQATTLSSLFDEVLLAAADAHAPPGAKIASDEMIFSEELRIGMSKTYNEHSDEWMERAAGLVAHPLVAAVLDSDERVPTDLAMRAHFVRRVFSQVQLARANNAVLVGDDTFQSLLTAIQTATLASGADLQTTGLETEVWSLNQGVLNAVGLDFGTTDLSELAAVRSSKDVAAYARGFREALSVASASSDLKASLRRLMREAMESSEVARLANGAFQTTGTLANLAGLVPFLGTVASAASMAADAASRLSEKTRASREWYLMGPKMRQIVLEDQLRRAP